MIDAYDFSAKLKCLFALTVASSGLQLEVVLRKGQRLLDRGPYTGAWTEAALAPRAAAHRATPPSPAVTGRRRGRAAYNAPPRRMLRAVSPYEAPTAKNLPLEKRFSRNGRAMA